MRIVFVYADVGSGTGPHFQQGIGSIVAVLKREGYRPDVLVLRDEDYLERLDRELERVRPQLLLVSATTNQVPVALAVMHEGKATLPELVTVIGGPHATLEPESLIAEPDVDIVCRGEGEFAVLALVRALERGKKPSGIANLWIKRDGAVERNPVELVENLDALPFPDRDCFSYREMMARYPIATMMAGRGCPFNCSYCCNRSFKAVAADSARYVRLRSSRRVVDEIKQLIERYPVKVVDFDDDTFTLRPRWVKEFCRLYRAEVGLPFYANVRVETIRDGTLETLREAGCDMIKVGVESGDEDVRARVLNRPMSNARIASVFRRADELGMKTWAFAMIGLPFETPAQIEATYRFIQQLRPNHTQTSVFYPYPGTDMYEFCRRHDLIRNDMNLLTYFDGQSILRNPHLSDEQLAAAHHRFQVLCEEIKAEKAQGYTTPLEASVLLPVKNGMCYLPELVAAVRAQQGVSFEIIAVDSGSSDGSAELLRQNDVRLHEIRPEQFHHARTRNLLASLARGRYLVFLTQDATPAEPRWLANLIAPFLSDDRLAGTFSRHIPRSDCRLPLARLMRYEWPQQGGTQPVVKEYLDEEDFRARHEELVYFSDTSSCIARSVWEVHPLPEVEFGEDRCWAEQVLRADWRLRYTPESAVWHSHDYSLKRQFMQNVDYGRFLRDMPSASGFSARRALAETADLLRRDYGYLRAHRLPRSLIARCVAWYLATFAGRCAGWYHDRWPWRSLAAFSLQATLRRKGAKGCP